MWIRFCNAFAKITGFPVQLLCFRTYTTDEDPKKSGRKYRGPAVIVSNHTSVYDYAVYIFVFFRRTLRTVMAEVLFRKPLLRVFLKSMGGIRVDRGAHDLSFIDRAVEVLSKKGTVLIFPEGRLPKEGEERPLAFAPSAALIALRAGVPVIPVYTNGSYFKKARARVIVGSPVDLSEWTEPERTEKENLELVTMRLREKIIALGERL